MARNETDLLGLSPLARLLHLWPSSSDSVRRLGSKEEWTAQLLLGSFEALLSLSPVQTRERVGLKTTLLLRDHELYGAVHLIQDISKRLLASIILGRTPMTCLLHHINYNSSCFFGIFAIPMISPSWPNKLFSVPLLSPDASHHQESKPSILSGSMLAREGKLLGQRSQQ